MVSCRARNVPNAPIVRAELLLFDKHLKDVITLADEADSQLKQTPIRYMEVEVAKQSKGTSNC